MDDVIAILQDPQQRARVDWQAVAEELFDLESAQTRDAEPAVEQRGWIAVSLLAQELAHAIEGLLDPLRDTLVQVSQIKSVGDSTAVNELRNAIDIVEVLRDDAEETLPDVLAYLPELLLRAREEVTSLG